MGYSINLVAKSEREERIKKAIEASTKTVDFYDFRNRKHELPVITIDISVPIYRMQNFRTFSDQHQYIADENASGDFFKNGQELETVQQVQHEILVELANKGKSDTVKPVIEALEQEKQREPLLIASNGMVVNGNRRLAAMRELLKEHSEFSHVELMVLPADATSDEILDVEANLQAKPETKLDYDWIGDGQLIHELKQRGRDTTGIAKQLNRTKSDIENTLLSLVEGEIYLRDWLGKPDQYSIIRGDAEQLFGDLPKLLNNKPNDIKEASRAIAYTLFENRDKINGRLYNYNPAIGKLTENVLDHFSKQLEANGITLNAEDDDGDDFLVDFEDDQQNSYSQLTQTLKDDETKNTAISALIEACDIAIETEKNKKSGEAALKSIVQAHSKLVSVDISTASKETYRGIEKQLSAISKVIDGLSKELEKYTSE